MSTSKRLTEVLQSATEIPFDENSKFVLLSDCHRGTNGWADDFAHNQALTFHALQHYFREGFTYIEVGDGDELWENIHFSEIRRAHSHLYWLFGQFYKQNRLIMLFGNHNIIWKYTESVQNALSTYYDEITQQEEPLFPDITFQEGIVLKHKQTQKRIFIVHGHQGDLMSDTLWWLSRFFVRTIWKPLQILGVHDPTSPAQNFTKRNRVERKITAWIEANAQPTICGHTHRPVFPNTGDVPYYNTGSCVHPRCITGIEIANNEIMLIKWWVKPNAEGILHIAREVLEGPRKIADI